MNKQHAVGEQRWTVSMKSAVKIRMATEQYTKSNPIWNAAREAISTRTHIIVITTDTSCLYIKDSVGHSCMMNVVISVVGRHYTVLEVRWIQTTFVVDQKSTIRQNRNVVGEKKVWYQHTCPVVMEVCDHMFQNNSNKSLINYCQILKIKDLCA